MKGFLKIIVSFVLVLCLLPIAKMEASGPFSDLDQQHWASREIMYLYNEGIISGYKDGSFRPNEPITRAQAAAMLLKALNIEPIEQPSTTFKDVSKAAYYYPILATINEKGIIRGDSGFMKPDQKTSRAQMAAILRRAFDLPFDSQPTYIDIPSSHWASADINTVAKHKIAGGYPDGTFKPSNNVTRAQFSVFLARALNDDMKLVNYRSYVGVKGKEVEKDGWIYTIRAIERPNQFPLGELVKINKVTKEVVVLLTQEDIKDEVLLEEGDWDLNNGYGLIAENPIILYNNDIYLEISHRVGTHSGITDNFFILKTTTAGGSYKRIDPIKAYNKIFYKNPPVEMINLYVWNDRIYFTMDKNREKLENYIPSGWPGENKEGKNRTLDLFSTDLTGNNIKKEITFDAKVQLDSAKGFDKYTPNGNSFASIRYVESNLYYYNEKGVYKYHLADGRTTKLGAAKSLDEFYKLIK